jgi:hypothetical protein
MGWIDSGAAYTVADGVPVIVTKPRAPFSIAVHPGAGATASIALTATPTATLRATPEAARWIDLETGIVDATLVTFPGPVTAIRLTSAGGETVFEVAQ